MVYWSHWSDEIIEFWKYDATKHKVKLLTYFCISNIVDFVIIAATTHVSVKKLDFVAQNTLLVMMMLLHSNSILQLLELWWELTVKQIIFILKVYFS